MAQEGEPKQKSGLSVLSSALRHYIEYVVPPLRNRQGEIMRQQIQAELLAKWRQLEAQQVERSLESAYSMLGDENGENVTKEQISAVLRAELQYLQMHRSPNNNSADTNYLAKALRLHTYDGLFRADSIMSERADLYRDRAFEEQQKNPYSELAHEAERRAIACVNASNLSFYLRVQMFSQRL